MPRVGERFNPYRTFTGNFVSDAFVPDAISKYRNLPPGSKLVYARLCRYAGEHGEAYPAIPKVAEDVGMSERQCWRYLKHLVDQRFLEVESRDGHSSVYSFLWHPCFEGDTGSGRPKGRKELRRS